MHNATVTSGILKVTGANQTGIFAQNDGNLQPGLITVNSTTLTSDGGGINASFGNGATTFGTATVNSGTVEVRGIDIGTSGAIIANGANVNVASGTITNGGSGTLNVTNTGTITTVGTIRPAGTQLRYSAGIIAASAAWPITIASNSVTTSGAQSAGIRVEASDGVTASAFSQGPGTAPVSVTGTGTIRTSGANAEGIRVQSGQSAATITNSGMIAATGAGSTGIFALDTSGALAIANSGSVATSGLGASAINAARQRRGRHRQRGQRQCHPGQRGRHRNGLGHLRADRFGQRNRGRCQRQARPKPARRWRR